MCVCVCVCYCACVCKEGGGGGDQMKQGVGGDHGKLEDYRE